MKAGRFGFMVLTRGPVPAFIDEAVWVTNSVAIGDGAAAFEAPPQSSIGHSLLADCGNAPDTGRNDPIPQTIE